MIRLTELPFTPLDKLFMGVHLQCVYMHLAERKDLWECDLHTHEYIEFGYIYKGSGQYLIDGTNYQAHIGDIFVIPPHVPHYEVHDPLTPFEIIFLMVKHHGDSVGELDRVMSTMQGKIQVHQDHKLKEMINDIYNEIIQRDNGYLSMIDSKLKSLYLLFHRTVFPQPSANIGQLSKGISSERNELVMKEMQHYILEHIDQGCSIESIAQHFFYHPKYLSQLFKRESGRSITEFIVGIRMDRAKELLVNSNEPVGEIAERLGYSSSQHFYKRFKQEMNITPVQFRNQYKQAPQDPF